MEAHGDRVLTGGEDRDSGRLPRLVLAVSMFVTGGCGLVAQYILSTVSTYILGNSIEQFSVIIALTLLMMGLAGIAQRFISDRALVEKFVATEAAIGILCGFTPLAMYFAFATMWDHFVLVQYFLILSIGFLIGLEIPLAIRINERFAKNLKSNIANIWALDYVGSFVGALIWAFLLIKTLPLTEISFLVGFLNLGVAALTLAVFQKRGAVPASWLAWAGLVLAAAMLGAGFARNRPLSMELEQRLYDDRIIHAETSKYQRIVITENPRLKDTRLFLNGNLQFSSMDEKIYHEQLVHPALGLAALPRRVLILGGGDGLAVREVLKHREVKEVVLVDLDPAMVALGRSHPRLRALNAGAFDDARVSARMPEGIASTGRRDVFQESGRTSSKRQDDEPVAVVDVYTVDAAAFARLGGTPFDVVIVDLPDPSSVELAKLYSREFYRDLGRLLAKDGVMVVQATSPYHAKEAFLCIKRTLASAGLSVLPYQDNVPSFGAWGWILAAHRPIPAHKIASLQMPETRYLTPEVFRKALVFGKGELETKETDTSTLMRPRVLDYYLGTGWQVD